MTSDPAAAAEVQLSPVRARSFMAAATASRALLEAMLAEPVPAGRRRTATATTRAQVVLAVVYLTLGYSKTADRFAMSQMEALTGDPARTIGRFLGQLAGRGWLTYHPADNHHARPLNQVQLHPADVTAATGSPGRSQDIEPVADVTATARSLIKTVLQERQPLATLRVAAVLLADLVTWLHTQGSLDITAVAARTHLDRKTVGRKLQALAGLGVLDYQPGQGRGVRGTVRLRPSTETDTAHPDGQPTSHRAREARPRRASPPLTTEQRDRANAFLGRVFVALERQEPGHGEAVKAALEQRLQNPSRLGQLITAILEAGGEQQLMQTLTRSRNRARGAYADADPPAALFRRVQNCHAQLGLTLSTSHATTDAGPTPARNAIAELLRPCLEHTSDRRGHRERPARSAQP